jgi:hypothetical protein
MNVSLSRLGRANRWLSNRAWVWIAGMTLAIVLLGLVVLALVGRVSDNSTKLSELRYRSCIEDSVLDFKIAEGDVVFAAFSRDQTLVGQKLIPYQQALDRMRGAQAACRVQFPD